MRPELVHASELLRLQTPESLTEALGLLQNTVYSFSMKVCGHREDAEDTAQEVLFRSLKYLPNLRDPEALAAWLYTVARNRCRRLRSVRDESPAHKLSLDQLMPDHAELQQLLLDPGSSPEKSVLLAEERRILHQAVLRIPSLLRIVLVLHDMEELSTDQVAQILNLQEGTVRVRLHRARLTLRREMAASLKDSQSDTAARSASEVSRRRSAEIAQRPKECRDLFASLSEYLDGSVKPEACERMRRHIEACPACVAFIQDLKRAIDRCRMLEVECDPTIASRLRELLTQEYLRILGTGAAKELAPAI